MKVCSKCGIEKQLQEFHVDNRYRLGVTGWCKQCRNNCSRQSKAIICASEKHLVLSKRCCTCKCTKDTAAFAKDISMRDGFASRCKKCRSDVETKARRLRPLTGFKNNLRSGYGMSIDDFKNMLLAQRGQCGICAVEMERPMIDHDHNSGGVRGLLCHHCNNWLAALENSVFMSQATKYVDQYRKVAPQFFKNKRHFESLMRNRARTKERQRAKTQHLRHRIKTFL